MDGLYATNWSALKLLFGRKAQEDHSGWGSHRCDTHVDACPRPSGAVHAEACASEPGVAGAEHAPWIDQPDKALAALRSHLAVAVERLGEVVGSLGFALSEQLDDALRIHLDR